MKEYERLTDILKPENNIVVFTGAGVSTSSGLSDFRGKRGLYKQNIDASTILSHKYFLENSTDFYKFYRENLIKSNINPNITHEILSILEDKKILNTIITQNIDGLHQKAGSKNVIELHGNGNYFYCVSCNNRYNEKYIKAFKDVPLCEKCGKVVRPDIVLYGEPLKNVNLWKAKEAINKADYLIVLGSSLTVEPACNLVHDFIVKQRNKNTKHLIIINEGETPYDYFSIKYDQDLSLIFQTIKEYISSTNIKYNQQKSLNTKKYNNI